MKLLYPTGMRRGWEFFASLPVIQHRCTDVSEQRVQKFPQRSGIGQRLVHKLASGNHE